MCPVLHRQLWVLIDCLDKYNLTNGFVGLSHQRPTEPRATPLLPPVPAWTWEVLRAVVVLGALGVLLYLGLQQYSTRCVLASVCFGVCVNVVWCLSPLFLLSRVMHNCVETTLHLVVYRMLSKMAVMGSPSTVAAAAAAGAVPLQPSGLQQQGLVVPVFMLAAHRLWAMVVGWWRLMATWLSCRR